MKLWWLLGISSVGAGVLGAACSDPNTNENSAAAASADCGGADEACCALPQKACTGELGCAAGVCKSITTNMVAYAEHCKEELGFRNARAKLPYMSCFDSVNESGQRVVTAKQAELRLSLREGMATRTLRLLENGPVVHEGKDAWDTIFGDDASPGLGCDNPNYLNDSCDPYYRLNVFAPDPGNPSITAAIHCRDTGGRKPTPSTAIAAEARKQAYLDLPENASLEEKTRAFNQYNDSSEIVLIMANAQSGKACFFHVATPSDTRYFGSRIPAPDDEQDIANAEVIDRIWNDMPVRPPFAKDDESERARWLRNGTSGWRSPSNMQCTSCHDSGPWMHNPFIDSMSLLPDDRRATPYLPLPASYHGETAKYVKTDPVRVTPNAEPVAQKCTSCHNIGSRATCGDWLDRAVGWRYPTTASMLSREDPKIGKYMPDGHEFATKEAYYAAMGPHLDAMKCCCEHSDWSGCHTIDRSQPRSQGQAGTGERSCTNGTTGGWHQPCDGDNACNHSGLRCVSQRCVFRDEE